MISIEEIRQLVPKMVCYGSHPGIIQSMLDYDYLAGQEAPSVVAIISNGRSSQRFFWGEREIEIPVIADFMALTDSQKAAVNCLLHVRSNRRVLSGMQEAISALPQLKLAVIFAEQVPEAHALEVAKLAHENNVLVIGPASVGLLIPGTLKLGAIGGTEHLQLSDAQITELGDTAIISTSGGMVNEMIHTVTASGLRVSFAVALGGDHFPITTPAEACLLAESDPQTKRIIYFGELGSQDEYEIAELVCAGTVTKKILAYVAGEVAELFETPPQFGHAKALAQTKDETAAAKKAALRSAGVQVFDSFAELLPALQTLSAQQGVVAQVASLRAIGPRRKHLIVSHISGEKDGHTELLGEELLTVVERNSLSGLILSMLLGRQVTSQKLIDSTDYALRLLVDHGPYVSGAANTIITARAGKDLVSSLAAGLLTIGPRFGGAINEAARWWSQAVHNDTSPQKFVDGFRVSGGIIPGIGHKKYRLNLPDPRVTALINITGSGPHLAFALEVQAITTAKKSNLILNIDGTIAAVLLDLLQAEMGYEYAELQELVDVEFFNALFVLSRSVGLTAHYMDQRRHDEGLLRLSDDDVSYLS